LQKKLDIKEFDLMEPDELQLAYNSNKTWEAKDKNEFLIVWSIVVC